jgi:hypothetical protein
MMLSVSLGTTAPEVEFVKSVFLAFFLLFLISRGKIPLNIQNTNVENHIWYSLNWLEIYFMCMSKLDIFQGQ